MLDEISAATEVATEITKKKKLPIQVKSLLAQLTNEVNFLIQKGDWDFAVRISYYRHEFAKTHNLYDWYQPFVEIRKTRDWIQTLHVREEKQKASNGQESPQLGSRAHSW